MSQENKIFSTHPPPYVTQKVLDIGKVVFVTHCPDPQTHLKVNFPTVLVFRTLQQWNDNK